MCKHTCLLLSFSACLLTLQFTGVASAGYVMMVGDKVAWPLTTAPSPTCYVGIVNDQGSTDPLAAWQLNLVIIPMNGATGELTFGTVDLPREPWEEYLLEGDSGYLEPNPPEPMIVGPEHPIWIGDYALSVFGNEIPSSTKTLAKVSFLASAGVSGEFGLAVVPGPSQSFWMSLDPVTFAEQIHTYSNVPTTGDPVVVGRILVGIPEPTGLVMLLAGLVFMSLGGRRFMRSS